MGETEGNATTLNDTDINSFNSISGLVHPRTLALLGVFLTDAEPEGLAPTRLDYYAIGDAFTSLAAPSSASRSSSATAGPTARSCTSS